MRARVEGEGWESVRAAAPPPLARLAALAALGMALGLAAGVGAPAALARGRARYRVHRVCRTPRPGAAACLGMKLVPAALSEAQLHANAVRQSREAAAGARPAVSNESPEPGFLTPQRLRSAYQLPAETSSSLLQTIALIDAFNDPSAEADLGVYDETFGLPPCTGANGCFRKVNESGAASPLPRKQGEWAGEISIDVQMAHAICPSCKILLVEASSEDFSDLGTGVNTAVDLGATVVSNSYGGPEEHSYPSLAASYYEHPGTLVAASSGDCGYFNKACPGEPAVADFPADSEHVLAVGGTSLRESEGVWTSSAWREGGSGCSKYFSAAPWQSAAAGFSATGCASARSVADVSAIGDPETGVDVYDSTPEGNGDPTGWGVWGGTSVSSPIVSAELALAGGPRGVAYPAATVYAHQGESSALYDVVSGSNGKCAGTTECAAAAGYDGPTGVGSPLGLSAFSIAGAPEEASPPVISGVAEQGRTLEAAAGQWSGEPTALSEQWARCNSAGSDCAPISGATGSSYPVSAADVGSTIRVQETAANAAGESAPAVSAATAVVPSNVPTIEGFTPTSGITGSSFTIEGSGLGAASEVVLGKLAASFTVLSSTQIEAVVPDGAKAGKVSVVTPGGTASTKSKFTPTLAVTSFSPKHGAAGKLVSVKGVGFAPGASVSFDGVGASNVSYVSSTRLKATVPAGATTGPISVTNSSAPLGTVSSAASFAVP
jgi:IPT/TIG domain